MAEVQPAPAVDQNAAPDVTPATPPAAPPTIDITGAASQPESPIGDYGGADGGPIRTAPARQAPSGFRAGFANSALPPSYHTDENGQMVPDREPVKPSFKGILGGILGGALRGASEGVAAEKGETGMHAAQRLSEAADTKAREVAEKNFQNKRAVQKDLLEHNLLTVQTLAEQQRLKEAPETHAALMKKYGHEDEEAIQRINDHQQAIADSLSAFKASISTEPHNIQPIASVSHGNSAGRSTDQAPATAGGTEPTEATPGAKGAQPITSPTMSAAVKNQGSLQPFLADAANKRVDLIQNGQRGKGAAIDVYDAKDLDKVIQSPLYYQIATGLPNADGTPKMEERMITPDGQKTYRDVRAEIARANAMVQEQTAALGKKAQLDREAAQAQQATATAEAERAKAEKDRITTQNEAIVNNPAGAGLHGEDYIKTLPPNQQDVVRAIGEGRSTYSDRQLFTKDGLPTPTLEMVYHAYPDFNVQNAKTWAKTDNEYRGSGATAKKIVNYNHSMEGLKSLYSHTTFAGVYEPMSKDYNDRQSDLSVIGNEVGNAIKNGVLTQSEGEEITKGISGAMRPGDSRERIQNTMRLLGQKLAQFQDKYQEGAPSQAVKVIKLLNPRSEEAYNYVMNGGKAAPVMPPDPAHVTSTGMYKGNKVFQMDDGRTLDAQGNAVSIPNPPTRH